MLVICWPGIWKIQVHIDMSFRWHVRNDESCSISATYSFKTGENSITNYKRVLCKMMYRMMYRISIDPGHGSTLGLVLAVCWGNRSCKWQYIKFGYRWQNIGDNVSSRWPDNMCQFYLCLWLLQIKRTPDQSSGTLSSAAHIYRMVNKWLMLCSTLFC